MLIEVPDIVGQGLADKADLLGIPLEEVIIAAASIYLTEPVHRAVARLVQDGLCDADIAALLHYQVGYIAKVRRTLKMPPNRRFVAC